MPAPSYAHLQVQQPAGPVLVGQHDGRVLLHFASPVTWVGYSPEQAVSVALEMLASAKAAGAVAPDQIHLF